jgi:hypothetical protein
MRGEERRSSTEDVEQRLCEGEAAQAEDTQGDVDWPIRVKGRSALWSNE